MKLAHIVRALFRAPFVTAIAVLSLALGIGANTAIFSVFDEMLLQPLPVNHPEQLVNLKATGPQLGSDNCNQQGDCDEVFSVPMFHDLARASTGFSGIAGHQANVANVAMAGQTPMNGEIMMVSGSYFPVLGIQPSLGRLLTPDDDRGNGGNYVTVLDYDYWSTQLGSDPTVLGKQLAVNGQRYTIVGVGPRGFDGTTIFTRPYAFIPLSMREVLYPGGKYIDNRDSFWVYLFARLKPGVSMAQAAAAVNSVYHPIITDVEAPTKHDVSANTLAQFRAKTIVLSDGRKGQSSARKDARVPLLMLLALTALVLLIACANIANLLLARGAARSMEMAIRLSIGATRAQLVAQLLAESLLLALLGGVASLLVAHWTLVGMMAMMPSFPGAVFEFALLPSALAFAAALSLGTGVLFGLVPAVQCTRPDLVTELRNNSGKLSGGRGAARFRTALATAQMALSMALLCTAGLFIRSLGNVSRVDLGVNIDNMMTFGLAPNLSGYDTARTRVLFTRVEQELRAVPGVRGVTASQVPVLAGSNWGNSIQVQGYPTSPDANHFTRYNGVGAGFFGVMGTPLLAGREFTDADVGTAPKVAIVNETFARKFRLGRDAVSKRISSGSDSLNIEIVGLVKDSKYSNVKDTIPPVYVRPYAQVNAGSLSFYVRGDLSTAAMTRAIHGVMQKLDPNLPVEQLKTMPQQVRENVFLDRMISNLSAAFALVATLLAAMGLYGVLAYWVTQRTREIGVRMALGADSGRVLALVLGQVGVMTAIGGAIGIAGALGLGRVARSLLYQMQGNDPVTFALAASALAMVALGAGVVPSLRALRVDPMAALRYE